MEEEPGSGKPPPGTTGHFDPFNDIQRMSAALDAFKDIQRMSAALDAFKDIQRMSAALDAFKDIQRMSAALDAFKDIQRTSAAVDALKKIQRAPAALDMIRDIQRMSAALDAFKGYREMAAWLTRGAVQGWARDVRPAVHEPLDEILEDFDAALADDSSTAEAPIAPWLSELPPLAQRRLFLLALAALWAISDALDSFAGVTPPAHLDKLVVALLAIATLLNEWIGEPPSD